MTHTPEPPTPSGHYFDSAATSPLLPEARDAMLEVMNLSVNGQLGNASSLHTPGHTASEIIENARAEIAQLLDADPSEIIFTSGGTESNNTVMHIFAGGRIITSPIEHPSVMEAAREYGKVVSTAAGGTKYSSEGPKTWPSGPERPEEECLCQDPRPTRTLYSVMLANNEIGTVFDIKALAAEAHKGNAYFHTDATQALGKIPISVHDLGVDYLTASAHKIGGPTGIGLLYVKHGAPYKPLLLGGHQENRRRAGTSQAIHIAGFGAAAKYARTHKTWEIYAQKIRPLRDELARRILAEIPHSSINGNELASASGLKPAGSLPNILNVSFRAAEGESIQLYLDLEGNIQVSTGSACASGEPSHTLMVLTGDAEVAHSSIRFSLGLSTTQKDIDHIMKTLKPIILRLQGISTIKIVKEPQ